MLQQQRPKTRMNMLRWVGPQGMYGAWKILSATLYNHLWNLGTSIRSIPNRKLAKHHTFRPIMLFVGIMEQTVYIIINSIPSVPNGNSGRPIRFLCIFILYNVSTMSSTVLKIANDIRRCDWHAQTLAIDAVRRIGSITTVYLMCSYFMQQ